MIYRIKLTTELIVEQDAANEAEAIAQALQSVPPWLDWRADVLDTAPLLVIPQQDRPPGLLDDEYDDL